MPADSALLELLALGPLSEEEKRLAERLQAAKKLQATPAAEGMKVGDMYVAANPLQHALTAMERVRGGQEEADIGRRQAEIAGLRRGGAEKMLGLAGAEEPDLYSVFAAEDEPTAAEKAKAFQTALRRRGQVGMAGMLSGDPSLTRVGAGMVGEAGEGQKELVGVGQTRLKMAMAAEEARARRTKEEADREFRERSLASQEAYRKGQLALGGRRIARTATGGGREGGIQERWEWNMVQKMGKDLDPAGTLAGSMNDLAILADAAHQARMTGSSDIPGIGPIAGNVPMMALGAEGQKIRQAAIRTIQGIVYSLSGKQVTEREFQMFLKGYGLSDRATTSEFTQGAMAFLANQAANLRLKESRYSPRIRQMYREGGGLTAEDIVEMAGRYDVDLVKAITIKPSGSSRTNYPGGKQEGGVPSTTPKATHRFNPATGRIEAIR